MPDFEDKIPLSEFSVTNILHATDRVPLIQASGEDWDNFCAALLDLALWIVKDAEYTSAGLNTQSKKIIGAINEVAAQSGSVDITSEIDTPAPIISFNDGGDNIPMKSLVTEIVPIQASGTPSPSNPLSISGFSAIDVNVQGKNWATYSNQKLINSVTPTITNGNVKVACSGSSGPFHQIAYTLPNSEKLAGKTITVSYDTVVTSSARVNDWRLIFLSYVNGGSETVLVSLKSTDANHATLNIGNSVTEIVVLFRLSQSVSDTTGDYVTWNKVQLEIGDENTTFEEYTDTTTTVPLGQTIYGGTADLVNGNGNKTWKKVKVSDYTWYKGSTGTYNRFYTQVQADVKMPASQSSPQTIISDTYATSPTFNDLLTTNNVVAVNTTASGATLNISDDRYTTADAFMTAMANVEILYELATPTAFTFTGANIPTLSGTNNIYTDCGDIQSLEYFNENGDDIASLVRLMTRT